MAIDQALYSLANRVQELKPVITTEEATKTALILPFIGEVLGYDVTDPREVIPEYTADIGARKGEKVDYAIKSGEDFRFLIECKKIGEPLNINHATQLVRYFNATDTDFAILTNGEVYEFYAQLDAINRMDEKPFMTLDLGNIDARIFPHLEMCTRKRFDSTTIAAQAEELKYIAELKKVLAAQFREPSVEWVKFLARRVTSRQMTKATVEKFTRLVSVAASQYVKDEVNRRLRSAQNLDEGPADGASAAEPEKGANEETSSDDHDNEIVTTPDEIWAYQIIRAISCREVPPTDIAMRDAKSYCAILYQDNNRKPIARLFLDRRVPRAIIFTPDRQETQVDLDRVEDLYKHSDLILDRVKALRDGSAT